LQTDENSRFIPFNRPAITGREQEYLNQVMKRGKLAAGGHFANQCNAYLRHHFGTAGALTTKSCTHALEMAALLCDLEPGDEVILPSYAFPSTAIAFARCGASLVFVDIEPSTMNIDPRAVEAAVTPRSRVIVALHYAGVSCNMDVLRQVAEKSNLLIVEDAAQAIFSAYRNRSCGTVGTFGCFSFHETKNLHCGEGGALLINDSQYIERAEIVWEKGTDRARFFRGEVDKYSWQDIGSSYALGELGAAFLLAQLEQGQAITADRLRSWQEYMEALCTLSNERYIEVPTVPDDCQHNGHIFWIKTRDVEERSALISFLREKSIHSIFHYVPLHSSPAGQRSGRFSGEDRHTSREASRLIRLPLFYGFSEAARVAEVVAAYYGFA
jgi:dTDP-4-amino-4,6-dideoxygalactose transaminase